MAKDRKKDEHKSAEEAAVKAYDRANAEILRLYEKLGAKLRLLAQKALERSEAADSVKKRLARRKSFEIYGDAATEVEHRVAVLRSRVGGANAPLNSAS